ncbi:MAG: Na+/H+ antiporter NhaA [Actinobacteria bacterium]|nr:MAG: Na+/H+ antiporter NhaA [Actinomycetota bacterium]
MAVPVTGGSTARWLGRTAWARNLQTPLRSFLRTETGGAAVLLAAAVAALAWVNVHAASYQAVWGTTFAVRVGGWEVAQDLRGWVNNGLMTFFFFTVGLEARREFDLGELRDRRRVTLPMLAAVGGMAVPVGIYLALNAGRPSAPGWGTTLSTDTAFALGMLALVGPQFPDRLRAFMLTVAVVDDLVSLVVIAVGYTEELRWPALLVGLGIFGMVLAVKAARVTVGLVYLVLGLALWLALMRSGVDPVVVGLAFGLLTYAYPAERGNLEAATNLFRLFREQPTPELARDARLGLASAISPNERLQLLYHPWTSYVIVPLFALCNAGIVINPGFLAAAYTSPVTLGIALGYLVGKPVGIVGVSWLVTRLSRGRLRPPVGWLAVAGGGTIAGIGFTVSLLVATLAFRGTALEEAKLGVLSAALCSSVLTWLLFRATGWLSPARRARALLAGAEPIVDLAVPVDERHDHARGPADAPVTLVEYGDFECPYCGQAEPVIRELLADFGDLRYVWRHLPLSDVHPDAQLAAEAAEAAAAQGAFWPMRELLFRHQDALAPKYLVGYAEQLGLDTGRFRTELRQHVHAPRVAEDVDSADLSAVSGTPTFFINGQRHQGAYDIATLSAAVRAAKARLTATSSSRR